MSSSFKAYIDESGDEGFKFREDLKVSASSDWFVLSAFVTRKISDLDTVKIIDAVRNGFSIPSKKQVHWKDLKHPQKVHYVQQITTKKARFLSVCVHKPSLIEREKFKERYRLYFWAVRYLMERLSWLVRDHHNAAKYGGDGTCEIEFSNRQGMSYEELKGYLQLLKAQQEGGKDIRIEFDCLKIDKISVQTPGRSMGLQLADASAGATFNALERDFFGNSEPRYLQTLLPMCYCKDGCVSGYGLKVTPRETRMNLEKEQYLGWLWKLK